MIQIIQKYILLALLFGAVACQRAAEEKTSIVISLPPIEKTSSAVCTTCLKFLAVNVSGEGIAGVIYAKKEQGDFAQAGTEISPDIEIEVPVGKQRQFQLVAAYSNTNDDIEVKYGSVNVDLTASTGVISLPVSSLGLFEGGHIVGRYLTGPQVGPTGVVNIKLVPVPGLRSFTLMKTHMINGWFDFFASKNFEISYEMENGKTIFSNVKLNRDFLAAQLTGNTQVARIVRPNTYYQNTGPGVWVQETEDDSDLVMGFFFEPGVSDPNKKVCKHDTTLELDRLSPDNGTTPMVYDPLGTTGDVRVYGGDSTCGGDYGQQYGANIISINGEQLNGVGNDTAKAMQGAFSLFKDGASVHKFGRSGNSFLFRFLPTLLGNVFDSAKLYIATTPVNEENVSCTSSSLSAHGFVEEPIVGSSISGSIITLTAGRVISTGYGVVCPVRSGQLYGQGGMHLGSLAPMGPPPAILTISGGPVYDYGIRATGSTHDATFTITNTGSTLASALSEIGLAAPFSFVGGVYPGSGGTCGSSLAAGNSCTIEVRFSPTVNATHTDTLIIAYFNGTITASAMRDVMGTSASPANLVYISGDTTFDTIVGTPVVHVFTIENQGGVEALIPSSPTITLGGSNYTIVPAQTTCWTTPYYLLPAGSSCQVGVEFTTGDTSVYNGTFTMLYNTGVTGVNFTQNFSGQGSP